MVGMDFNSILDGIGRLIEDYFRWELGAYSDMPSRLGPYHTCDFHKPDYTLGASKTV